ncbi:MAG: hypothetical protein L0215_04950 [Gemmataceae bacterium]|nr:hypothetical protein [Gemmataceae bacterium]
MSSLLIDELATPHDVRDFIKANDAEEAFKSVVTLARECYPQMITMNFRIQEDPDEIDRRKVLLDVTLAPTPFDDLMAQEDTYHQRFITEIPLAQCPLFGAFIRCAE